MLVYQDLLTGAWIDHREFSLVFFGGNFVVFGVGDVGILGIGGGTVRSGRLRVWIG